MVLSVKKTEEQSKKLFREMLTCKKKKREREEQLIKCEEKAKEVAMEPGDFRVAEVKFRKKHTGPVKCSQEVTVTTKTRGAGARTSLALAGAAPPWGWGPRADYARREASSYQQGRRLAPRFGVE